MATVTIEITRSAVFSIAEGISVTISQHNGGTPSFEQLWASADESRKLDIYYREAISDLERRLMLWAEETHAQFNLTADGDDYTLKLGMSQWWPSRMEPLLANKIQDYLVHAVTAGWLGDFEGLSVKTDYLAAANLDVADILEIVHQRSFDFEESSRGDDSDEKPDDDYDTATSRADDSDEKPDDDYDTATSRADDSDEKPVDDYDSATSRAEDSDEKPVDDYDAAKSRGTDGKKDYLVLPFEAGFRKKDNVKKSGPDDKPFLCRERTDRHRDNAAVCQQSDWTDMSGTGIAYGGMAPMPARPMRGMGYTPSPGHLVPPPVEHAAVPQQPLPSQPPHPGTPCGCRPGCPPPPSYNPRKDPKLYPEPPYHAVPPHYPPFPPLPEVHPNGKDWSDMDVYDQESEEKFIDSHICGQPGCHDPFGWADEEENNNQ